MAFHFYTERRLVVLTGLKAKNLLELLEHLRTVSGSSIFYHTHQQYLNDNGNRLRECPPGDEFHFCKSKSFIMHTGLIAHDLRDFIARLPHVTNTSTYYHFFESRLRLERPTNDFSMWLAGLGETELAEAIDRLDPYIMTLDELRQQIFALCSRRLAES